MQLREHCSHCESHNVYINLNCVCATNFVGNVQSSKLERLRRREQLTGIIVYGISFKI